MRTEKQIWAEIRKTEKEHEQMLMGPTAVTLPEAILQGIVLSRIDALYFVLKGKRAKYPCEAPYNRANYF